MYTIAFEPGGDAAALYDDKGDLVRASEASEVMEHLLHTLEAQGVITIRENQRLMPEGAWQWRDAYPTLTEQQQANGA